MNEQKIINKQLLKNMFLNLIAFTLIFSIFGIIIYGQVTASIYKSADEELLNIKNRYGILSNINKHDILQDNRLIKQEKIEVNPRLIYVIRNEKGTIQNEGNLERIDLKETIKNLKFDLNNTDRIYEIQLENYKYRGINYKLIQNGEVIFVQILINVDAEEAIITNFVKTLITSIIIIIALSILASYLLSLYTLKPIIFSLQKQMEFVQNASHELRTPLTIIQTKQELLLEEPNSKIIDKAEEITISLNETKRLSKLVKDLMVLAKNDSNKMILSKSSIDIDKVIREITVPYIDLASIQEKNIILNLEYNKQINVDKDKISQLLVIVLDNSIKYTEKGNTIEIDTYEKDNKCNINIKDTGIGISDETIIHMFDRFYREDKARLRKTGGSGLGLSIAKAIVNAHGGVIKASHNGERGTIISIVLPKQN